MKIVLVEDDAFLGDLISTSIINSGFELTHVTSGEEALKKIPEVLPDIILLDLILPGINGFEVLEKLKSQKGLAQIPVIIVSNLGGQESIDRAMSLGAVYYFVKSDVLPSEIIAKVNSILGL